MQEVDDELVARAIRFCAEAGRHATPGEVRAALGPLSWDQLLTVKALLADSPPARPLGPHALADIGRGTLPEVAAEREREDRYRPTPDSTPEPEPAGGTPEVPPGRARPSARAPGKRGGPAAAPPVVRRARDRVAAPPSPAPLPCLDDLFRSEGRTVLERLVRTVGAQPARLTALLAEGWRRPDGSAPGGEDLAALLQVHGLARGFARRERDEILHALRAAGGLKSRAAERLGMDVPALDDALARVGAGHEAEEIRRSHASELRRRATLSERVRMLLADRERLVDLGVVDEIEADVRKRLPEHVRALRASGAGPLGVALARSLAVGTREAEALAAGFGIDLGTSHEATPARPRASPPRREAKRAQGAAPISRPRGGRAPATPGPRGRGQRDPQRGSRPTAGPRPGAAAPGRNVSRKPPKAAPKPRRRPERS